MRRRMIAAAAALLTLGAPAYAGGIMGLNGTCLLFCDSKPAPKPTPEAASGKPVALFGARRHRHDTSESASTAGEKHSWRQAHASRTSAWARRTSSVAAAAHPTPPTKPQPVAAATPTPTAAAASLVASSVEPPASAAPVTPAPVETSAPSSPAADANPAAPAPDQAARLLAQAFAEQPAPTPAASPEPSTPKAEAAAPPPPQPDIVYVAPRGFEFVQVTANGVVIPWWPTSFPGRAAIWLTVLSALAATGLGVAKATGARLIA